MSSENVEDGQPSCNCKAVNPSLDGSRQEQFREQHGCERQGWPARGEWLPDGGGFGRAQHCFGWDDRQRWHGGPHCWARQGCGPCQSGFRCRSFGTPQVRGWMAAPSPCQYWPSCRAGWAAYPPGLAAAQPAGARNIAKGQPAGPCMQWELPMFGFDSRAGNAGGAYKQPEYDSWGQYNVSCMNEMSGYWSPGCFPTTRFPGMCAPYTTPAMSTVPAWSNRSDDFAAFPKVRCFHDRRQAVSACFPDRKVHKIFQAV